MSYTPQTVSEMLELPPSTLRRYASEYADFLSASAKAGTRKRRYTDQDIIILRKIKELTRARKTAEEIRAALQIVDKNQPTGSSLAMLPDVLQGFENLRADIAAMQADRHADREELSQAIKRLEALEEYFKLPWFRRIFRRPPE